MGANRPIVQQREDGRWEVKAPRTDRASVITDTQSAAIDRARGILSKDGGGDSDDQKKQTEKSGLRYRRSRQRSDPPPDRR